MTERTESASAARTLDRRILVVWTVQTAVLVLVLAAIVLAVDVGSRLAGTHPPGPPGLAAALVALAGGVAAWRLPNLEYRNWRYEVAEDALELRHGILRRVHSGPGSRGSPSGPGAGCRGAAPARPRPPRSASSGTRGSAAARPPRHRPARPGRRPAPAAPAGGSRRAATRRPRPGRSRQGPAPGRPSARSRPPGCGGRASWPRTRSRFARSSPDQPIAAHP